MKHTNFSILGRSLVLISISVITTQTSQAVECNGSAALCSKKYNECTYPTTHNAQSNKKNFLFSLVPGSNISNQDRSIWDQLKDGIRAMKIPVHPTIPEALPEVSSNKGIIKPLTMIADINRMNNETFACHGFRSDVKDIVKSKLCNNLSFLQSSCNNLVDQISPCTFDPAARKLETILGDLKRFLKTHPNEVVTIFVEDYTNDFVHLQRLFERTSLSPYMHRQNPNRDWPTLAEMIDSNRRLVVFVNHDTDKYGNSLDQFEHFNNQSYFVWGSKFHFESVDELKRDKASGQSDSGFPVLSRASPPFNKLWVLQHFTTQTLGGSEADASVVNSAPILRDRVQKYKMLTGAKPNFIWVDFYELPEDKPGLFDIVHELNGTRRKLSSLPTAR